MFENQNKKDTEAFENKLKTKLEAYENKIKVLENRLEIKDSEIKLLMEKCKGLEGSVRQHQFENDNNITEEQKRNI